MACSITSLYEPLNRKNIAYPFVIDNNYYRNHNVFIDLSKSMVRSIKDVGTSLLDTYERLYNEENMMNLCRLLEYVKCDTAVAQLKEIANLQDNWNDNGAEAFSDRLIEKVYRIVDDLPEIPLLFPTACGSIQMEYEKKDGSYIEFEIYEDFVKVFCIDNKDNETESVIKNGDYKKIIKQMVVDFYA